MNLSWIDWTLLAVSVVVLRFVSLSTRHYMKGVADFLSANRSAGRYLLTIASQMGGIGVVSFVASFEATTSAGFTMGWWGLMSIPVGVIILLTGWVFYRFRETRALTMAQFFEMRYSKNFRIYAGFLCWISGILNFGIFPALAARFFVYFCGLPDHFYIPWLPKVIDLPFAIFGLSHIDMAFSTFATVMAVDLLLALGFVTMGGQISVMITECVQGIFCAIAFVVVAMAIMVQVNWGQMVEALSMAPKDASMLNPFHTSAIGDFNIWFVLIGIVGNFYSYMSWQGSQGFYSSARTPHEQKMGGIIGIWRGIPQGLLILLLPLAAITVLNLPEFSAKAALINQSLKQIPDATIQGQMKVPIAMTHILPVGIKGLLATVMLFISFTCHDTYMHSWGAIFVQDVVMPLRKKAMTPEQHIKFLRWSIIGVAVFAYFWSLYYKMNMPIYMYFALTGTIWLGGSGAIIVGGLYWRKGTTAGAYTALTVGTVLGLAGLLLQYYEKSPVNGQWLWFIAMVAAGLSYLVVSLITGKVRREGTKNKICWALSAGALSGVMALLIGHYKLFPLKNLWLYLIPLVSAGLAYILASAIIGENRCYNLERMLNRGKYKIESDSVPVQRGAKSKLLMIIGITEEFSFSDKLLAIALVVWNGANFLFFVIFSLINLFIPVADSAWAKYWHFNILLSLCISIPAVIWFTIGGVIDMKALFKTLTTTERDVNDNGQVLERYDEMEKEHPTTPMEDIEDQLTALVPESEETSADKERK